jgi:hypothetical protein
MDIFYILAFVYITILMVFELSPILLFFRGFHNIQYSFIHSENNFPGSANLGLISAVHHYCGFLMIFPL